MADTLILGGGTPDISVHAPGSFLWGKDGNTSSTDLDNVSNADVESDDHPTPLTDEVLFPHGDGKAIVVQPFGSDADGEVGQIEIGGFRPLPAADGNTTRYWQRFPLIRVEFTLCTLALVGGLDDNFWADTLTISWQRGDPSLGARLLIARDGNGAAATADNLPAAFMFDALGFPLFYARGRITTAASMNAFYYFI